jgi:hypothetical protein
MSRTYNEILDHVRTLEIIDSHEHLPHREDARDKHTDVLKEYLTHYFNRDLVSAGLKPDQLKLVMNPDRPILERWQLAEPYWNLARHTGYGRALDISARALYGVDQINGGTIEQLNEAFLQTLKPGHYRKVLKDMSQIRISLLDSNLDCDREFFRSVYRLDRFIYPRTMQDVEQISQESGIQICSFEDWLDACESMLDRALQKGAVALKSGLAYERTLLYERVTRHEAEESFNLIFRTLNLPDWKTKILPFGKPFQDYMMHFILRLANRRNLTYQFHTGLQEGNGNYIYHSDPALLSNLFLEYPQVDFDIFHIGYPYQQVLSALAKNFPNVYIDMCWAHIISPTACVQALIEWLDAVPANKIIAFGGDYCFIDAVYGHQLMARENVSKSLAAKVEEGVFDIDEAARIAQLLFCDNPMRLFKLEQKL